MLKSIHLMIAKRDAEIRLVAMDVNDPFRSAYEGFLSEVDEWINHYEKLEG
jgi:3-methyladenine DNA glycosylase AlkD